MAESRQQVDPEELAELAELADDASRRRYFSRRPDLRRPDVAWLLAEESGRSVRIDLERAARLAATARWLADEVGDPVARARSLRAAGNVLHFKRRYEDALRAYDEALAGFDEAGAEIEAAITRSSASGSLSHLARFTQALEYADGARLAFERHGDLVHLGRLEVNVGLLLARQDRFPTAIQHFRRALELFQDVGQPVDLATTLRNIAVCYQDLNDFHSSLETYREAREFCRRHGVQLVGLEVEYNIAYIYYLRGEYSQAIHLFEEARRHSQEQGDAHHAALCDLDLAEIFLELNLVQDAAHLARRAFDAFSELAMEYEAAKALAYQALAAARHTQRALALDLLRQARRLFRRQGNRVWVAMVELYEASILFAESRLEEAEIRANAASAGFRDSGVPSRRVTCEILRARLAAGLGDLPAAGQRCTEALELASESGRPLLEFQAHLVSGQIAEAGGDPAAALAAYGRAHHCLERLRGQLRTDELKIAFTDDKQAVYEGLVAVTLAGGESDELAATAFGHVETAKSRGLSDLLAYGSPGIGRPSAEGDPLVEQLAELRHEINWYYRQISAEELRGSESSQVRLSQLRSEVRQREQQLLRDLRRLQATDAELMSLQGSSVADLDSLRATLPAGCVLIEYFIARDLLYRFELDHERLVVRPLGPVSRIRELHRQVQFQFGKFRLGDEYMRRFGRMFESQALTLLQELHEALLGDWRPRDGIRHLIVVPHDFLHHVPFHALHDGERFVVDRLSVSYAPSATVFHLCALRPVESAERSLVMGVSDKRAPRILDEARAVARILPGSRLLLGAEATRDSLSRLGDGCRFLHLATHGLYRRDNPMFSALQLGDTRMSLLDLYDLRLEVELAVLSGCATGLSDVQGSDELVGLTRGLLFAGARSVVATLWDVNDDSTARFMQLFYSQLIAAVEPAAALQRAMASLREEHPHPYYWAPFVLTGAPRV